MSQEMGKLESKRLIIRPFIMSDLQSVHQILDHDLKDADFGTEGRQTLTERKQWLKWLLLNYEQLSKLKQPPYGERAIMQKDSKEVIGICGYVPCLDCFEQLCDFNQTEKPADHSFATSEFGLFYAISKGFQGFGFATEAALIVFTHSYKMTASSSLASIRE